MSVLKPLACARATIALMLSGCSSVFRTTQRARTSGGVASTGRSVADLRGAQAASSSAPAKKALEVVCMGFGLLRVTQPLVDAQPII